MRLRRLTLLALALVGALVASVVATAGNRAAPEPALATRARAERAAIFFTRISFRY